MSEQPRSQHSPAPIADQSSATSQALPDAWIDRLFARMTGFYGARFADAWSGCDPAVVRATWAEELADYSVVEIRRGINRLRDRPFPPTLPEFLLLCRPKPDPQAAFAEAARLIGGLDGWSDCSVFWAAREIGWHDLKTLRYEQIAGRWRDALERAWAHRRPIPQPAPVAGHLAAQSEPLVRMTAEQRAAVWERLRAIGGPARRESASEVRQEVERAAAEIAARTPA